MKTIKKLINLAPALCLGLVLGVHVEKQNYFHTFNKKYQAKDNLQIRFLKSEGGKDIFDVIAQENTNVFVQEEKHFVDEGFSRWYITFEKNRLK